MNPRGNQENRPKDTSMIGDDYFVMKSPFISELFKELPNSNAMNHHPSFRKHFSLSLFRLFSIFFHTKYVCFKHGCSPAFISYQE